MDTNNDNNDNELIGESKIFNEQINTIKTQFFSALDDFKKYYVYFNKNPEVSEFANFYSNSKGQLQTMSRNIVLMTNTIDKTIEDLNKEMSDISAKMEREKKLNSILLNQLHNLEDTQNGSEILVDDSRTAYNIQYYKNWQIFIGMILVIAFIVKSNKAPVTQ